MVKSIFRSIPPGEDVRGFAEYAAVGGVTPEGGAQPDNKGGYGGFNAFRVDGVPETAYIRRTEAAGIEAVCPSVLVAGLTAAPTFSAVIDRAKWGCVQYNSHSL